MDVREANEGIVCLIETVERHGYMKIAELIDGNHLDEARQVAEILKEVGVV